MEKYLGRDQNNDLVTKEKPIDYYECIYYQPIIRRNYDDWFVNIKDKEVKE